MKLYLNFCNIFDEAVKNNMSVLRLLWDKYIPKNALASSVRIYDNEDTNKLCIAFREQKQRPKKRGKYNKGDKKWK